MWVEDVTKCLADRYIVKVCQKIVKGNIIDQPSQLINIQSNMSIKVKFGQIPVLQFLVKFNSSQHNPDQCIVNGKINSQSFGQLVKE